MDKEHILKLIFGLSFFSITIWGVIVVLLRHKIIEMWGWSLLGFLIGLRWVWPSFFDFHRLDMIIICFLATISIIIWWYVVVKNDKINEKIKNSVLAVLVLINAWLPGA